LKIKAVLDLVAKDEDLINEIQDMKMLRIMGIILGLGRYVLDIMK
jgi:hypothetical protein